MGHIFCFVLDSLYFIIVKKTNNICILKGPLSTCFLTGKEPNTAPCRAGVKVNWDHLFAVAVLYAQGMALAGPVAFLCFSMTLGSVFSEPRPGNVLKGLLEMFIFCDCVLFIRLLTIPVSLKWRLYYTNILIRFNISFRPKRIFFSFNMLPNVA